MKQVGQNQYEFETQKTLKVGDTIKISAPEWSPSGMQLDYRAGVRIDKVEFGDGGWFKITATRTGH